MCSKEKLLSKEKYIVLSIILCSVIFIFTTFLLKYYSLGLKAADQSCFWYVIENFMRTGSFFDMSMELGNHLGIHFSPILAFFSLFQFLSPNSILIMLFIYSVLMGLALFYAYRIGSFFFPKKDDMLKRVICLMALVAYVPFLKTTLYDFDPIRLAPFLLLGFFYYAILKEEHVKALIFIFLMLITRETMPLIISGAGLYLIFYGKKRTIGFIYLVSGFTLFILVITILMPYFRNLDINLVFNSKGLVFGSHYPYIAGKNLSETLFNFVTNPIKVLKVFILTNPFKWVKFLGLFAFLFFLPLFRKRYLILSSFIFILYYLATPPHMFEYVHQYYSEIYPAFILAFAAGFKSFLDKNYKSKILLFLKKNLSYIMLISFSAIFLIFFTLNYAKSLKLRYKHLDVINVIHSDPLKLREKNDIAIFFHNRLFYQWGWKKNMCIMNHFEKAFELAKKEVKEFYVITYLETDYALWNINVFKQYFPLLKKLGFKKAFQYQNFFIYKLILK